MNNKELEKLKEISKKISLSVDEKNSLRESLISQMRAIELREGETKTSRQIWRSYFLQPKLVPYFALILIFVLSFSGVAAAQMSLPGDPFYGIKVNVNEKLKGVFLVSNEDKAQREIELVSRRLEETRNLALAEKLTPSAREVVENQLEKHTEKIKGYIKTSEKENDINQAIDLQSQLQVALATNEKILTRIEPVSAEVSPVVAKVRQELSDVSEKKTILQNDLSVSGDQDVIVVAKNRLEAAKKITLEAEKLVNLNTPPAGDSDYTEKISEVKQGIEIGENLLEEGMYQEALIYFDKSFRDSSEIKFSIENSKEEEVNKIFIQNKSLQLGIPQVQQIDSEDSSKIVTEGEGSVKGVNIKTIESGEVEEISASGISPSVNIISR